MFGRTENLENRIRTGDIRAFESLFHTWYPSMCTFAESIVNSGMVAEEIVQDIFYNIWKNRATLLITTSWKTYLMRAVYNNSLMYLRKARREQSLDVQTATGPVYNQDPSSELQAGELNRIVEETLLKLPSRTRKIFSMNRMEGLKYKEIARELSISVKTVEANMGKALRAFRLALKDYRT